MNRQIIAGLFIAITLAVGGCGSDEKTAEGTNESGESAKDPGDFCGGFGGIQCEGNLYCDFPPATKCGSGDQGGVCKVPADVCTKNYDPVCGCDGKTYGNACEASRASTSVLHEGEC